jgi:hypothetical protein
VPGRNVALLSSQRECAVHSEMLLTAGAPMRSHCARSTAARTPIPYDDSAPVCAIPQFFSSVSLLVRTSGLNKTSKSSDLRAPELARFRRCTGITSICETAPSPFESGVDYMTWAAGSNPVRKRALGASRRDTCFLSFRQLGQILGGGRSGRTNNRIENAAANCAAHSEMTTQHVIAVM